MTQEYPFIALYIALVAIFVAINLVFVYIAYIMYKNRDEKDRMSPRRRKALNQFMLPTGVFTIVFGLVLLANASEFPMIFEGFPFDWIIPTLFVFMISMGVQVIVISYVNRPSESAEPGPVERDPSSED